MKYACYIGRWQTWHPGHVWLINQKLEKGIPVLIMIREPEEINESNPKQGWQIKEEIDFYYREEIRTEMVKTMVIPDIESFNYGRGVGYEINEHKPPEDIKEISGTSIRAKQKEATDDE
jgi:hypothetical protein